MFHRLACCLAALLSVSLTGIASAQQRVTFKPNFQAGQDLVYPLAMRQSVANEIQDEGSDQWLLVCSATMVMHIDTVESDGAIKATGFFKRGSVRLTEGDKRLGYAWGPDARDDPDWGAAAELSRPLASAKFSITVDAKGKAVISGGLDAFMASHKKIGGGDERLLGFFSPEKLGNAITPIFAMDDVSRQPISAGKEWQATELVPVPGAGDVRVAMDIMLQRIDPNEAEYTGIPRLSFSPMANRDPDAPAVTLIDGGGGVSGIFDLSARVLRQRKQSLLFKTQWVSPKQTIIQTQQTTMYLQLGEAKR